MLMGVISFYDVAKAVVDSQNFENRMLKAYIRDWPVEKSRDRAASSSQNRRTDLHGRQHLRHAFPRSPISARATARRSAA